MGTHELGNGLRQLQLQLIIRDLGKYYSNYFTDFDSAVIASVLAEIDHAEAALSQLFLVVDLYFAQIDDEFDFLEVVVEVWLDF